MGWVWADRIYDDKEQCLLPQSLKRVGIRAEVRDTLIIHTDNPVYHNIICI